MQNMPFYKPKGRLLFFNTEYTLHYRVCVCRLTPRFLRSVRWSDTVITVAKGDSEMWR